MDININLIQIEIKIAIADAGDTIAFAEVHFKSGGGESFIVRGYRIQRRPWGLDVKAPAYSSRKGYSTAFVIEPTEMWYQLKEAILTAYKASAGPENLENIDPDEIPKSLGN